MECDFCHEDKDDVSEVIEPFGAEIYGSEDWVLMCDECHQRLCDDI